MTTAEYMRTIQKALGRPFFYFYPWAQPRDNSWDLGFAASMDRFAEVMKITASAFDEFAQACAPETK